MATTDAKVRPPHNADMNQNMKSTPTVEENLVNHVRFAHLNILLIELINPEQKSLSEHSPENVKAFRKQSRCQPKARI